MLHSPNTQIPTPTSPRHIESDQADVLYQINNPDIDLSLWRRPVQTTISQELLPLEASRLPEVRHPTSLESFDDDIRSHLSQYGLDPTHFEHLLTDLNRLASLFSLNRKNDRFKFRLATTAGDDCTRFHLDRTPFRLVCTYRGPGTEWLTEAQSDRKAYRRSAANESLIRYGAPQRLQPFWVGVMRGDPGNTGQGLLHRSPPIAGSGQVRVLFCLDG